MTEHKCSIDKLVVIWKSDDNNKYKGVFTCPCGKEYTWDKLVELMPFKEIRSEEYKEVRP